MSKFKFGDKVSHSKYGFGVIISNRPENVEYSHIDVAFKEYKGTEYSAYVEIPSLTLVSESDWVKCSERMPELNVPVLVHTGSGMRIDKAYDFGDGVSFYEDLYGDVTHWMPLPTPPQD